MKRIFFSKLEREFATFIRKSICCLTSVDIDETLINWLEEENLLYAFVIKCSRLTYLLTQSMITIRHRLRQTTKSIPATFTAFFKMSPSPTGFVVIVIRIDSLSFGRQLKTERKKWINCIFLHYVLVEICYLVWDCFYI